MKLRKLPVTALVIPLVACLVVEPAAHANPNSEGKASAEKSAAENPKGQRESQRENRKGDDIASIIDNLDYPELMVVPRASERLKLEAKDEDSTWFLTHWPIEASGLMTAYLAISGKSMLRDTLTEAQKTEAGTVSNVTAAVGIGWVAAGVILGMQRPYRTGLNSISKITGKDERSTLLRERLAEEALESPARIIRPLQVASVITNFGTSILMGSYLTDQGRITAGVSAVLAFLPFIFEDPTVIVYEKHLEYKKKIYGPISSTGVGYDPRGRNYFPTAQLTWNF